MVNMNDKKIRIQVLNEFNKEPKVNNPDSIEVIVEGGVVTLSGHVDNYVDQQSAEAAAKRVPNVKAVVQNVSVRAPTTSLLDDEITAQEACQTLDLDVDVPHDRVKVVIQDGWVALEGEVDWLHEKEQIESAVNKIKDIKGISNNIVVKSPITAKDLQSKIQSAIQSAALHRANHINVEIQDGTVVLTGEIRAWIERGIAEAACKCPGIKKVENKLSIHPLLANPVCRYFQAEPMLLSCWKPRCNWG